MRRLLVALAMIFAFLVGTAWYVVTSPDSRVADGTLDTEEVVTSQDDQDVAAPTTLPERQELNAADLTSPEAETSNDGTTGESSIDEPNTEPASSTTEPSFNDAENSDVTTPPTNTDETTPSATTAGNTPTPVILNRPYVLPDQTGTRIAASDLRAVGSRSSLTYVVDTPGAVISGLDIEGCVVVEVDNVTIQDSRITCRADRSDRVSGIEIPDGVTGVNIVNNTIACTSTGTAVAPCTSGIRGSSFTASFNNISGGVNGILAIGPRVTASNNYIHSLKAGVDQFQTGGQSFNNGLRSFGGTNIVFQGNYLEGSAGTIHAVFVQPEDLGGGGNTPNAIVQDNFITGDWDKGINCRSHSGNTFRIDCDVEGNIISATLPGNLIEIQTRQTSSLACNTLVGGGFVASSQISGATQRTTGCR